MVGDLCMSKIIKIFFVFCSVLSFILGIFVQYVGNYYRVDIKLLETYNDINVESVKYDNMITYGMEDSQVGIIFYPGGKVEYTAYEPLMKSLAAKGFFCVLLKMPYNLAVFGIDSADGMPDTYPKIRSWYMMGHSLGGSMAGMYLVDNYNSYDGLVLLSSYVTNDLSNTDLNVISIYGSEDKILNKDKYNKYKDNLPLNLNDIVIQGGNHAYFGVYGKQNGDGDALITNEQQIKQTVDLLDVLIVS